MYIYIYFFSFQKCVAIIIKCFSYFQSSIHLNICILLFYFKIDQSNKNFKKMSYRRFSTKFFHILSRNASTKVPNIEHIGAGGFALLVSLAAILYKVFLNLFFFLLLEIILLEIDRLLFNL